MAPSARQERHAVHPLLALALALVVVVRRPASARAPYRKADVVRGDILDATVDLLSEHPLHDVGVRDIAARAGVHHSLVTRHFGTKDALVAEAIGSVAADYAAAVGASDDGSAGFVNAMRHLHDRPYTAFVLMAPAATRAGDSPADRFPGYAAHLAGLREAGAPDDLHTRVAAGMALAMVGAWNVLERFVLDAAGVDPAEAPEARALAEGLLADFVRQAVERP